jgi:hypothetical protein
MIMVDLGLLQSVSYIAGALGVSVAAVYYVMNLKETNKNRRITTTSNILNYLMTTENQLKYLELLKMEWKDFDDFTKKYDSRVNPENWAIRAYYWGAYDVLGYQWKEGLVDIDLIDRLTQGPEVIWRRFGSVIQEYRKTDYASDAYKDFENLAIELTRRRRLREPDGHSYDTVSHIKPYEEVFGKKS